MTLEEFKTKIQNNKTHIHKITNSYGVYDYYKYYRKHKPKDKKYILTESQYFTIIRKINSILAESFVKGNEIVFPIRMGTVELRKSIKVPRLDATGKVIFNTMIDWDKTLKLWYEDPESFKNKTLVKQESAEIFKTFYNKSNAIYNNKSFYAFQLNRDTKRDTAKNIKKGLIDAFLIY